MRSVRYMGALLVAQSVESLCLQCRRLGLDPLVEKIPWRRKWLPTPVFLLGQSYGQRSWTTIVHGIARVRSCLVTKPNQHNIHGRCQHWRKLGVGYRDFCIIWQYLKLFQNTFLRKLIHAAFFPLETHSECF